MPTPPASQNVVLSWLHRRFWLRFGRSTNSTTGLPDAGQPCQAEEWLSGRSGWHHRTANSRKVHWFCRAVTNRNQVVLLHGLGDTAALFDRLCNYLEERGWTTHRFDLVPRWGGAALEKPARQVASYIDRTFPDGEKIDLIGFSMGGLIGRYYIQRLGGLARVSRLITISTPHQGTLTAYLHWNRGIRQMRPRSDFLRDLNHDSHVLKHIRFTTIWTPWDLMILPAASSVIPEARPVRVGILAHPLMVRDRRVFQIVEQALSE
jgi:triacylglycerol lipase